MYELRRHHPGWEVRRDPIPPRWDGEGLQTQLLVHHCGPRLIRRRPSSVLTGQVAELFGLWKHALGMRNAQLQANFDVQRQQSVLKLLKRRTMLLISSQR